MNVGTGRFWTQDDYEGRQSDPSTLHKYLYTGNNPINDLDPSGNSSLLKRAAAFVIGSILSAISYLSIVDRVQAPTNDPIRDEISRTQADYDDAKLSALHYLFILGTAGIGVVGGVFGSLRRAITTARAGKRVNVKDVDTFVGGLPRKTTPTKSAANQYEVKHTGSTNYKVSGGGASMDIDGYEGNIILETKYIGSPSTSPFVPGSNIPDAIRQSILRGTEDAFRRLGLIVRDPDVPFYGVKVITNNADAAVYFDSLLRANNIPGIVVVKQ